MESMGKQEGSSGVGASMKLFIAAPSSQALAAVSTTLPRRPPPRPRGQEYHALTPPSSPKSSTGYLEGGRERCDSPDPNLPTLLSP